MVKRSADDMEADNTAALQAALDQVVAAGGGTLWLPAGVYGITQTLVLKGAHGVQIRGVGGREGAVVNSGQPVKGTAILWNGPQSAGKAMLSLQGCQDIYIENLFFTTTGAPGVPGTDAQTVDTMIQVSGGQNIWVEGCGAGWLGGQGAGRGPGP